MSQKVHMVSFDIPYPADYGGVIDVFYKVKALHAAGVRVHLHCFEYHRPPAPELEAYCEQVYYYPRQISGRLLFHKWPYIVVSRQSETLLENLLKNNWPVLLEGLHCTWILNDRYWNNRRIIVRTHNVEHEYYRQLARAEKNLFRKYYFMNESTKLEAYESVLSNASGIAAITEKEREHFHRYHHTVRCIPAFHGHTQPSGEEGLGKFILYHGNLSIAENHKAAMHIAEGLKGEPYQLVIAGSNPRKELKEACKGVAHITLVANPREDEMQRLMKNAHLHVLFTFQNTGLKLKLLNALFEGRFCLVNKMMVEGTGLEDACVIVNSDDKEEWLKELAHIMNRKFTENDRKEREILLSGFSDEVNGSMLIKMLFEPL